MIEAELSLAHGLDAGSDPAALDRIARESERLKRIVDDLLWLRTFRRRPSATARRPDRPRDDRRGLRRALRAPRQRQVARPSDETARSCTPSVVAPAEWIDRLAAVLVDNACKFAGEGGRCASRSACGSRVVLAVEDTGPGIPPAERERLFDRFRRGTNHAGGHGLGLAIADSVVRSTGGKWRVDDAGPELGGARLEVSWPA